MGVGLPAEDAAGEGVGFLAAGTSLLLAALVVPDHGAASAVQRFCGIKIEKKQQISV